MELATPLILKAGLRRWLMDLCTANTTSGREDAGKPALRRLLAELGAEVLEQPVAEGRTNLLATWGQPLGGPPRILFSTHLDTVSPFIPPHSEGERVFGRGTCDAKGQIVAQLAAIEGLLADGLTGIAWLGVVGEETDSAGAEAALELKARFQHCKALICGEPTELKLASGQRGIQHFVLSCQGRAAHSSTPEAGSSALWPLLEWLHQLRRIPRPADPELGQETWNLGLLQGGEGPNVVPDYAQAHVHARVVPGSDLEARIREFMPSQGQLHLQLSEPADRYPEIPGFDHAPMPFGSDAPRLRALVPDGTVVLAGPGNILLAHGPEENISLTELEAGIELNRRLALHFLGEDAQKAKR